MPAKRHQLIIWGAGGHAAVVADAVRQTGTHQIVGFVDDAGGGRRSAKYLGVRVLGSRTELAQVQKAGVDHIVIAIGDCAARLELAGVAQSMGFRLCSAIHPRATVASSAKIGAGTVIVAGAVVNSGAVIGENSIVNTCASVDHDCVLQDGVHVCPGAHLAGNVTVGRGSWIGIGATVIERIRIGQGAFIAAGAVVVTDIPDGALAQGVPAKVIRKGQARRSG
ncbi:MAG TPA: acetyltransferase [Verrucomicrobiae bacterium]|nr:acetyltransferase [Verrucomicrobiae bacterium]